MRLAFGVREVLMQFIPAPQSSAQVFRISRQVKDKRDDNKIIMKSKIKSVREWMQERPSIVLIHYSKGNRISRD